MFRFKKKRFYLFSSRKELENWLSPLNCKTFEWRQKNYLIVIHEEKYFLILNQCPHQNKTMEGGYCEAGHFICPIHQYRFDLETGRGHGLYLERYPLDFDENGVYFEKEVFSFWG